MNGWQNYSITTQGNTTSQWEKFCILNSSSKTRYSHVKQINKEIDKYRWSHSSVKYKDTNQENRVSKI